MRTRRWRQRRQHDAAELNITAFMNLMVILVPFLLITAVFSRLTILELSLPAPGDETATSPQQSLQLEVIIRARQLEVADTQTGLLKVIPALEGTKRPDLVTLSAYLQQVKAEFPQTSNIVLLLEPDTDYNTLVQIMDTVRAFTPEVKNASVTELFPDISIGDAALETVANISTEGQ
ncbi:MAG: biopolymer transporter ExbD [Gammaproteobacteria bacterium]|nr:biopolymer transporter ExbD [Gammaproteobacteria bacterium]